MFLSVLCVYYVPEKWKALKTNSSLNERVSFFGPKMSWPTLVFVLAVALGLGQALESVVQPTCSLKDNCNLGENLLTNPGGADGSVDVSGDKLESKIASIFEDKVNYSLKLFAEDATTTILEYQTANLSDLHAGPLGNFSIHQLEKSLEEDDQVEEDERGKFPQYMVRRKPILTTNYPPLMKCQNRSMIGVFVEIIARSLGLSAAIAGS